MDLIPSVTVWPHNISENDRFGLKGTNGQNDWSWSKRHFWNENLHKIRKDMSMCFYHQGCLGLFD